MTVESSINRVDYVAAADQTDFTFAFKYFESGDISVFANGTEVTTGFTVTPSAQGVSAGGTVTFSSGRASGDTIAILRVLDIVQESDYEEGDRLPSQQLEDDLDRQAMINQQQQEELRRRPALSDASLITDVTIPDPSDDVVGHAFVWRKSGSDFVLGTSTDNVDEALATINTTIETAETAATNAANSATASASSATASANSATASAASATQAANSANAVNIPVGMIAPLAVSSAPLGWLECRGQNVSRVSFSELFDAIGTTYGAGDGSTTFTLPDLRDRTVVGKPSSRTLGNFEQNAAPNITGNFSFHPSIGVTLDGSTVTSGAFEASGSSKTERLNQTTSGAGKDLGFDASNSNAAYGRNSASKVVMDNVALLYCIKAFGTVVEDAQSLAESVDTLSTALTAIVQATETERGTAEIATDAETATGTDNTRFVTPLKLKNSPALTTNNILIVSHTVASATSGGSKSTGWETRPLQTVNLNNITGASLSVSNYQITLPAGTYYLDGYTSCFNVGDQTARLRTTGGTNLVGGGTSRDANTSYQIPVQIQGRFTLSSSTTLILQHYSDAAENGNGWGAPSSGSGYQNKYAELTFFKVG